MTRLLLSERTENARKTCSRCCHNVNDECRYPVLVECIKTYSGVSLRTARLINYSDDGLTCQLYREAKE